MKPGSSQLLLPVRVGTLDNRPLVQVPGGCRRYTEAVGMHQALAEADARVQVVVRQGSWGTEVAAVVAGTDGGLEAEWMRVGLGPCLQLGNPRASSLAVGTAG
jgi:hypothetical protein